ncbi:hypothetical protein ACFL21_01090 [Patescibacteria group bacterium]
MLKNTPPDQLEERKAIIESVLKNLLNSNDDFDFTEYEQLSKEAQGDLRILIHQKIQEGHASKDMENPTRKKLYALSDILGERLVQETQKELKDLIDFSDDFEQELREERELLEKARKLGEQALLASLGPDDPVH